MKFRTTIALVCVFALLMTATCISRNSAAGNATLRGWVQDDEQKYIDAVSVKVYNAGSNVEYKTTSTSGSGYYEFSLPTGKYDVKFVKEGYAEGRSYNINLPSNYTYTLNATLPKQSSTPQIDWTGTIFWSIIGTVILLAIIGLIYLALWLRDRRKRKQAQPQQPHQPASPQQYQQPPG